MSISKRLILKERTQSATTMPEGAEQKPEEQPGPSEYAESPQQNGHDEPSPPLEKQTTGGPQMSVWELTVLFGAVFFSVFLMALNGSIVATVSRIRVSVGERLANPLGQAIPRITSHFKSLEDIGWYGSASLISTYVSVPGSWMPEHSIISADVACNHL